MEKLPYYARMLKKETPKLKPKPAKDAELFSFAKKNGWAKKLDPKDLELMRTVIGDYGNKFLSALDRIVYIKVPKEERLKRVLGELTCCGNQFVGDIKEYLL